MWHHCTLLVRYLLFEICTYSAVKYSALTFLRLHYHAAIAVLWIDFVREVRWCWDEGFRLPRVSVDGSPDLESCLLHQKLQMVMFCKQEASSKLTPFVLVMPVDLF